MGWGPDPYEKLTANGKKAYDRDVAEEKARTGDFKATYALLHIKGATHYQSIK